MEARMRKHAAILSTLALLTVIGFTCLSFAGDETPKQETAKQETAKQETWTGWITDETCGAQNANAEGKACALKCAKNGAKLVLYVEDSKKLIGLDDQGNAMKHVGVPVMVTGTLDGDTIKVQKI